MVKLLLPVALIVVVYYLQNLYLYHLPINLFTILLDICGLDLSLYFFHVYAHHNRYLWKIHEIHHIDQKIDATTGLRIHFAEPIVSLLFKLPIIYFLAIPTKVYIFYEILLTLIGIFHHSNIKIPYKLNVIFDKIITMPSIHCVHHHATPKDTNSNYGFVFSFWDRIFGTINNVKRKQGWQFGLKYSKDKALTTLLFYPFTNKNIRDL